MESLELLQLNDFAGFFWGLKEIREIITFLQFLLIENLEKGVTSGMSPSGQSRKLKKKLEAKTRKITYRH